MTPAIRRCEEQLVPATKAEVFKAVGVLLTNFARQNVEGTEDDVLAGYWIAVEGEPEWAITRAVREFLRGQVQDQHPDFMPSPARLAEQVRKHTDRTRDQLKSAHETAKQIAERPAGDAPRELSAFVKARVEAMKRAQQEAEERDRKKNAAAYRATQVSHGIDHLMKVADRNRFLK